MLEVLTIFDPCSFCLRSDFYSPFHRLENSNGTIVDHFGGGHYSSNRRCLFFIEADPYVDCYVISKGRKGGIVEIVSTVSSDWESLFSV